MRAGKDQIERLLALGATRTEATADLVGRSIKLAMTPLLNTMSVVGLVSIPGVCVVGWAGVAPTFGPGPRVVHSVCCRLCNMASPAFSP